MDIKHHVESYRFWDVVTQWARETLQHELVMARALAKAEGYDPDLNWEEYKPNARAAVEAMRQPTTVEMATAAYHADNSLPRTIWSAMIAAILSEKPE